MAHSIQTGDSKELAIDNYKVIRILADDIVFCSNWKSFCLLLEFENAILVDLDKMAAHCSIKDTIINIMRHWKSISPSANLVNLSKMLEEFGCKKCSEEIQDLCELNDVVFQKIRRITVGFPNSDATTATATTIEHSRPCDSGNSNIIWFNIREPTKFYLGRHEQMKIIDEQWKLCLEQKTLLFVAITGLGGIGKTEIARNYAKHFYKNLKGNCIWINAETDQSLKQSLHDLAEDEINLSTKDESGKEKSLESLLKEMYRKLSGVSTLIIFDNLECYANSVVQTLSDLASKQPPGVLKPFVLTTSRFRPAKQYFGCKCVHLELDVLSEESAMEFFLKSFISNENLKDESCSEAIGKLCERLQCYPLAMQQAAAYINENLPNGRNAFAIENEIHTYLEKMEKEAQNLLNHKLPKYEMLESHSRTTFLTWKVTFDKIRKFPKIGSRAIELMAIISLISPDNIFTAFLFKLFATINASTKLTRKLPVFFNKLFNAFKSQTKDKNSETTFDDALELLRNHSMIKIFENKISVHRLVQEITRIDLEERGKFISTLDKLIESMERMLKDEKVSTDQLIHVQTVWQFAVKIPEMIKKYPNFPHWIVYKLHCSGRYKSSFDFSCQAIKELESILGEENRSTLTTNSWKGFLLEALGEYQESLSLLLDVYEKQKKLFGEEDDECLDTSRSIGNVYYRLENYEEAIKWYEDALEKRERIYGKEHSEALALKYSMALVLLDQGKAKEAMELNKKLLEVEERLLGKNHPVPDTVNTMHIMAYIVFQEKNFEEALKMFQEVLEMKEEMLELDHPDTLLTKIWIAHTYKSLGRVEEALQLAKEVYEKRMEIFGRQHPHSIDSFNLLEELKKVIASREMT